MSILQINRDSNSMSYSLSARQEPKIQKNPAAIDNSATRTNKTVSAEIQAIDTGSMPKTALKAAASLAEVFSGKAPLLDKSNDASPGKRLAKAVLHQGIELAKSELKDRYNYVSVSGQGRLETKTGKELAFNYTVELDRNNAATSVAVNYIKTNNDTGKEVGLSFGVAEGKLHLKFDRVTLPKDFEIPATESGNYRRQAAWTRNNNSGEVNLSATDKTIGRIYIKETSTSFNYEKAAVQDAGHDRTTGFSITKDGNIELIRKNLDITV
jgi:hypothetical protein